MSAPRTDCEDAKCRENYKQLLLKFPTLNDETEDLDYCWFHCREQGCREISLGKMSTECGVCHKWMCQVHLEYLEHDNDDFDDLFCFKCLTTFQERKFQDNES